MHNTNGGGSLRYMLPANEHRDCYASSVQREVLVDLLRHKLLTDDFSFTGGPALSVFYLHHRTSNDLDLFTLRNTDLEEMDFTMKTLWAREYVKIKSSPTFLSLLIRQVKVDFVVDRLSIDEKRECITLEPDHCIRLDTPRNILSNKLCALASRVEPKDYVDYYTLSNALQTPSLESVLADARNKDAIFDDPPTAAYQIEQGLTFLQHHVEVMPELRVPIDREDFTAFYTQLIHRVYDLGANKASR
jgi:hypothetical protein